VLGITLAANIADARVTQLNITSVASAFGGASFGSAGTYEVITGTFTDEVDPDRGRFPPCGGKVFSPPTPRLRV
jgi:hypothetical protein